MRAKPDVAILIHRVEALREVLDALIRWIADGNPLSTDDARILRARLAKPLRPRRSTRAHLDVGQEP